MNGISIKKVTVAPKHTCKKVRVARKENRWKRTMRDSELELIEVEIEKPW